MPSGSSSGMTTAHTHGNTVNNSAGESENVQRPVVVVTAAVGAVDAVHDTSAEAAKATSIVAPEERPLEGQHEASETILSTITSRGTSATAREGRAHATAAASEGDNISGQAGMDPGPISNADALPSLPSSASMYVALLT